MFMNVLLGDRMVMNYMPTLLSAFTVGGVVWLLHKCNLQRPCEERERLMLPWWHSYGDLTCQPVLLYTYNLLLLQMFQNRGACMQLLENTALFCETVHSQRFYTEKHWFTAVQKQSGNTI